MGCNHENKMFPVYDRNEWMVGFLCDCGHFEVRVDMPDYEGRTEANRAKSTYALELAKEVEAKGKH